MVKDGLSLFQISKAVSSIAELRSVLILMRRDNVE